MSGFKGRRLRGHHRDEIDITTTDVFEAADRTVEKTSKVKVAASDDQPERGLWIGLKLLQGQDVVTLTVNKDVWVPENTRPAQAAIDRFRDMFPPKPGEVWTAYSISHRLKQGLKGRKTKLGFDFETDLKLSKWVAVDPDAQTIPIAVCYIPDDPRLLTRKDILLGHSVVPGPPRALTPARGKTRGTKRAAARRGAQRRRRRRS